MMTAGRCVLDGPRDGIGIADVQLRARQANGRHARRHAGQQAAADLALRAGDEHLQG